MRFRDKYFPYPVIRTYNEDFTKTTFDINIETSEDIESLNLIIKANVLIDNKAIINEVKSGRAKYVIHIEESETMFREAYTFDEEYFEINIPLSLVRSELQVISFITVCKPIIDFYSNDFNLMYEGIKVEYDENNIIGIGSAKTIKVTKEDDEIEGVSSIFMIIPDEEIKETFILSLDPNRVTIKVSKDSFNLYNKLTKTYSLSTIENNIIVMSLMVLPAFIETLNILKNDYQTYSDYIWFDSLVSAYEKKGINIIERFNDDSFDAYQGAQIIFNDVINKSLKRLDVITLEV